MTARVLLIEDQPDIADMLAEELRSGEGGFHVVVTSSAATGLERIRRESVDCVLLDYRLPDCDGLECLTRIKENWPDLPVIMITGEGSQDVAVEAMKRGATDYVVKERNYLPAVVSKVREAVAKGEFTRATKRLAHGVFIGRDTERAVLREAVEACLGGRGGLFLIEGEAGIGKTALAHQTAAYAEARGVRTLRGRCDQSEGAPPYWPWIEILRACVKDSPPEDLKADLSFGIAAVAQIVPELAARLGQLVCAATDERIEPEQARFRLFDSVTTFLKNSARRQPTLIVLDDAHWADLSSVLLLQFLARELGNTALLVVCAYRDSELLDNAAAIAQLHGDGSTLRLLGLSEEEVKEQIGAISNQKVPARFARTLFRRTEGNPFFVEEILRLLIEERVVYHDGGRWTARSTPEEMPIPVGAREILLRRLAHISDGCREILSIASVIGRVFELDAVTHLTNQPLDQIGELLDEAEKARVIARLRGPVQDYTFCQAMVRGLLYESLPMLTRAALHRRFGEYLEMHHATEIDLHVASLAHHFIRTTDPETRSKAHQYALRAAARAATLMAHEEAARHYETALKALSSDPNGDATRRLTIILKTSECWWRAGDSAQARRVAMEASEIARGTGDASDFARAALAYAGQLPGFGAVVCDHTVVRLLEEALAGLGNGESGLHALLMGRLAEEITFSDERERRRLLGKQAVDVARRSGDPSVLASVLKNMHWALWTPEKVEGRLEQADEVIRLATATRDESMEFEGHLFRCVAKLELADMPAVQEEMAACARMALELRQPYHLWLVASARVCLAFSRGRLDEIEGLAHEALELGEQAQNPNAKLFHDVQLAHLCWQRGKFTELAQIAQKIGSDYPLLLTALQCALAANFSEQRMTEAASAQLESLAVGDFERLPRDVTWAMSLTFLTLTCALLGDAKRAACLYDLMQPFEHRVVVLAPVVPWGPASHYLGLLAATMGNAKLACRHYDDALAMSTRLGMAQWLARTQLAYAELLLSLPDASDRAIALLESSLQTSESLGMPVIATRARSLLSARTMVESETSLISFPSGIEHESALAEPPRSDHENGRGRPDKKEEDRVIQLFCEGKSWLMVHEGKPIPLGEHNGFSYLYYLLREPGREFHVVQLWALVETPDLDECSRFLSGEDGEDSNKAEQSEETERSKRYARRTSSADPNELVDSTGLQSLRTELQRLDAAIQEAEGNDNSEKASRLRKEREWIRRYRNAAYGLGGRKRTFVDPTDRLRQRIQKAISRARKAVQVKDEELGWHLWKHVKTGFRCSYQPDPTHPVTWEL